MSYRRLLAAWLLLAVLMPLNGILRELWLKTLLDHRIADAISAGLGIAIILVVTRLVFRIAPSTTSANLWRMSVLLVALTVAFECTFGRLEGKSWSELLSNYALWRGRLWPLVLLTLGATPFIWRGRRQATPP